MIGTLFQQPSNPLEAFLLISSTLAGVHNPATQPRMQRSEGAVIVSK